MTSRNRNTSEAVIRRLPRYYRCLADLEAQGVERTSSQDISRLLHLTASQIRQDFNCFGGFGQQGYGYHVSTLKRHLERILGLERTYRMIVVGAGNLGHALVSYNGFSTNRFDIIGVFDTDPQLVGQSISNLTIQDAAQLLPFARQHPADIGVITVNREHAQAVADQLVLAKVSGLWNFAPVDVTVPAGCHVQVENVHLNDSLHVLAFRMTQFSNG